MKGLLCYYSGSGNTKLVCEYIKAHTKHIQIELYDIVHNEVPDITDYDVVGFATFTDFVGPPPLMIDFIKKIEQVERKGSFTFISYGFMAGKTLKWLSDVVKKQGFTLLGEHMMKMPENYPPQRKRGYAADEFPTPELLDKFKVFVDKLDTQFQIFGKDTKLKPIKYRLGLIDALVPRVKRGMSKKDFGVQSLIEEQCITCGICEKGCPYDAIEMTPKPVFDHDKCEGCWYCYNNCSRQAIVTEKFRGECQYPRPLMELKEKLT